MSRIDNSDIRDLVAELIRKAQEEQKSLVLSLHRALNFVDATLAQLAERGHCKSEVVSSTLTGGSCIQPQKVQLL